MPSPRPKGRSEVAGARDTELLGREPIITVSTIVALLIAVLPIFGWSTEVIGIVAGALVVIGGAVEAALVSIDKLLPLLVGVAKAVLAAVAAFGVHVPGNWVVALMAVLTVVAGLKVRDQVVPAKRAKGNGVDVPGFIRQWNEAERAAGHTGIGRATQDFATDLDDQRGAPPLPERSREDDTQVFHLEPNSTYRLEAHYDIGPDGPEQREKQSGRHRSGAEFRPVWGHLNPDLGAQ